MFFNRKKEVFLTSDVELFGFVISALKQKKIPYETKTVNMGTQNRRSGTFLGQIGEKIDLEIMYYVYVNAEDVETAQYIIRQCQRQAAE